MEFSSKVTHKKRHGRKGDPIKSSSVTEHMKSISDRRNQVLLENEVQLDIDKQKSRERLSIATEGEIGRNRVHNTAKRLTSEAREQIFREIMVETFKDSLVLDKWAIDDYSETLEGAVVDFIDKNGGYSMLTEAVEETGTPILKKMVDVIESTTNRVVERVLMESKENASGEKVNLSLTADEKEDLDVSKAGLQLEEVTEVIKRKVVDVVKEEKERSSKQEELESELESSTEDDDLDDSENVSENEDGEDDTDDDSNDSVEENESEDYTEDDKPVKEASYLKGSLMTGYTKHLKGVHESTLFNTMFQETMTEAVNESVTLQKSNDEFDTRYSRNNQSFDPETDNNEYDDEMIEDEVNSQDASEPAQLNLDLILADTISQYTLLEMFHTLNIKTLSRSEIREYSMNTLNK